MSRFNRCMAGVGIVAAFLSIGCAGAASTYEDDVENAMCAAAEMVARFAQTWMMPGFGFSRIDVDVQREVLLLYGEDIVEFEALQGEEFRISSGPLPVYSAYSLSEALRRDEVFHGLDIEYSEEEGRVTVTGNGRQSLRLRIGVLAVSETYCVLQVSLEVDGNLRDKSVLLFEHLNDRDWKQVGSHTPLYY